jgi:uncharacterized protein YicC (UPF0701 family)
MADPIKMLRSLESALEKAKLDKANLEGQKASILKELMEVFEISTVEEGEDLLQDYKTEIETLESQMTSILEKAQALLE